MSRDSRKRWLNARRVHPPAVRSSIGAPLARAPASSYLLTYNVKNTRPPAMSPNDPSQPRTAVAAREPPPRLKVAELLGGAREAILEHDGQDYRLRITAGQIDPDEVVAASGYFACWCHKM